jgi:hypothetical protein
MEQGRRANAGGDDTEKIEFVISAATFSLSCFMARLLPK